MSSSTRFVRVAVVLGGMLAAVPMQAQTWQNSAPAITASATIAQIRQFDGGSAVNLNFGTDGVTPGVAKTVTAFQANAASGTGAKVDLRFNTGTKVTVTGSALTATINATTHTITPTYACSSATDQTGTGAAAFPTTCAAGAEWLNSAITGMMFRSVGVGATISAAETSTKPAGTYTGTITVVLSASSS